MQSTAVLSCQCDAFSRAGKCGQQPRTSAELSKKNAAPAIESCRQIEANRQRPTSAEIDSRTRMLLEQPIAPMILRLAIPNATVMTVQILIGLVEVYFVSQTGVDGLAGVAPVFPLVSLVVAVAQGAIGRGIVTTVARALGAGRIGAGASRRRPPCMRWVQASTARWASPEMLWRSPSPIRPPFLQVPR